MNPGNWLRRLRGLNSGHTTPEPTAEIQKQPSVLERIRNEDDLELVVAIQSLRAATTSLVRKLSDDYTEIKSRFDLVRDVLSDAIVTVDCHGQVRDINAAGRKLFGISAEAAEAAKIDNLIRRGSSNQSIFTPTHFKRGKQCRIKDDVYGIGPDGKEFPLEAVIARIESSNNQPTICKGACVDRTCHFIIVVKDISAAVQSEQKIADLGEFNNAMFHAAPIGIFYQDKQFRIVGLNDAFLRIYELKREDVIDRRFDEVFVKSTIDAPGMFTTKNLEVQDFFSGQETLSVLSLQQLVHTIKTPSGREKVLLLTNSVYRNSRDEFKGIIGTVIDITSEKTCAQKIDFMRMAINHVTDHFFIIDSNADVIFANDKTAEIFKNEVGCDSSERLCNLFEITDGSIEDRNKFISAWNRVREGETWEGQIVLEHMQSNQRVVVDVTFVPVMAGKRYPMFTMSFIHKIETHTIE